MNRQARMLLDNDRGSATIWSLLWFTGFCAIMGIAIDTTGAMHTEAKMQHTADAAAHAGVIDIFPNPDDAVEEALKFGAYNAPVSDVVNTPDVIVGHWNSDERTFTDDPSMISEYNAVKVFATRDSARDNALLTTFLRVVGFYNWDIAAASIAYYTDDEDLISECRFNGLIAGGLMEQTANNTLSRNICVHGEGDFKMTSNNVVTCGVQLSVAPDGNYQGGTPPTYKEVLGECNDNYPILSNFEMMDQSFLYRSLPSHAELEFQLVGRVLQKYMQDPGNPRLADPLNIIPSFLVRSPAFVKNMSVTNFNNAAKATGSKGISGLVPGTLYNVTCSGGNKQLVLEGIVRNVGIYTNCEVLVQKNKKVSAFKPIKDKTGVHAIVSCDPHLNNDCNGDDWKLLLEPMLTCAQNLATVITTEPTSILFNKYPEPYQTLNDTAGSPYRDGTMDPDGNNNCGMEPGATGIFDNVLIYTTANKDGNRGQTSITFPNNFQAGRIDGCTQGGSVRMYLGGSVSTPSSMVLHGVQIIALGDVQLAAKSSGVHGIVVDAVGKIKYSAQGEMGGCSADAGDGESDVIIAYRPIALVD